MENVQDLLPRFDYTRLNTLTLSFDRLPTLPALSSFTRLTSLDVSHNALRSLEGIENLVCLGILRAQDNLLQSLQHIIDCVQLQELWFSENDVPWQELFVLKGLHRLQHLVCYENPCDENEHCVSLILSLVPNLRTLNGTSIDYDVKAQAASFARSADSRVMRVHAQSYYQTSTRSKVSINESVPPERNQIPRNFTVPEVGATVGPSDGSYAVATADSRSRPLPRGSARPKPSSNVVRLLAQRQDSSHSEGSGDRVVHFPAKGNSAGAGGTVALRLHADGTGFVRWARTGPMAVSIDATGQLLASYSNGSIAVTLDSRGNGSICDKNGRTLLSSRSGCVIIMGTDGSITEEFNTSADSTLGTLDNAKSFELDKNLRVCCYNTGEMTVTFANEVVECEFSNQTGGKILEVFTPYEAKSQTKSVETVEFDHESLRNKLKAITGDLDNLQSMLKR